MWCHVVSCGVNVVSCCVVSQTQGGLKQLMLDYPFIRSFVVIINYKVPEIYISKSQIPTIGSILSKSTNKLHKIMPKVN